MLANRGFSTDCAVRNTAVIGCRKSLFFQKKCLFSIPIRTLCGLCVLQSLAAYTPDIRAGAILLGLPPLVPVGGYAPATPFSINKRFIDRRKPPCETRRFIVYLIVSVYLITLTEITASPALILSATLSALPLTSRTV